MKVIYTVIWITLIKFKFKIKEKINKYRSLN